MTIWFVIAYLAVIALTGIDQWTKIWAVNNLRGEAAKPFLQIGDFDWMHLWYVENDGAAFSMLSGSRWFLVGFSALMIAVCLVLMQKLSRRHKWLLFTMPLIAAGGLGNLIDRLFRGGMVVDFFDLQLFRFAVFNFADICVSVGVILTAIFLLFVEKDEPEAKTLKSAKKAELAAVLPDAALPNEVDEAKMLDDAEMLEEAANAEGVADAEEAPDA